MMGRSSKQAFNGTETGKGSASPMSGAYIRSLVKQLTTSTARTTKDYEEETGSRDQKPRDCIADEKHSNSGPAPPPYKKQVRRRLHTTRPYQERLLNMAEARREIVAALKFHRAAMKQAQEQQQQQQQGMNNHNRSPTPMQQNPIQYPPNYMNYQLDTSSTALSPFPCAPPAQNYIPSSNQSPFSWPMSPISPLVQFQPSVDSLPITLPSQTLGLNLNIQEFDNLYHNGSMTSPSIYSTSSSPPSSSSLSSSSSVVSAISHEVAQEPSHSVKAEGGSRDHGEMAEAMMSIGERHQMEWNDSMNLVTSAWWFEFLKGMETGDEEAVKRASEECYGEGDGFQIFDEVMEFPPWLGGGESCLEQHLVDDCSSDDYFSQDASLACMDIGEIEGIDGEWLS